MVEDAFEALNIDWEKSQKVQLVKERFLTQVTVVTADGRVISAGGPTAHMKGEDSAPLLELYEAQALESTVLTRTRCIHMNPYIC